MADKSTKILSHYTHIECFSVLPPQPGGIGLEELEPYILSRLCWLPGLHWTKKMGGSHTYTPCRRTILCLSFIPRNNIIKLVYQSRNIERFKRYMSFIPWYSSLYIYILFSCKKRLKLKEKKTIKKDWKLKIKKKGTIN